MGLKRVTLSTLLKTGVTPHKQKNEFSSVAKATTINLSGPQGVGF